MVTQDYFYVFKVNPNNIKECLGNLVFGRGYKLSDLYDKYWISKLDGDNITAQKYIRTTRKTHRDIFEEPRIFNKKILLNDPCVFTTKTAINEWKDKLREDIMEYKDYLAEWLKDINLIKIRATVDRNATSRYQTKEVKGLTQAEFDNEKQS